MARGKYETYVFTVDNVEVGMITLQKDVEDRFNINGLTSIENRQVGTRERKGHQRKVYTNRNTSTTTRQVNVSRVVVADVRRKNRVNSGKKIKVPLDLTSTAPQSSSGTNQAARQTQRMTTINFPLKASNYQIARWINTHFTANKPSYFITPAGARYPVNIPAIQQQTAGETGDTTPTTP